MKIFRYPFIIYETEEAMDIIHMRLNLHRFETCMDHGFPSQGGQKLKHGECQTRASSNTVRVSNTARRRRPTDPAGAPRTGRHAAQAGARL